MTYKRLRSKVFRALGAASVCWSNPEGAGEFDSERANEIGEQLMKDINEYTRELTRDMIGKAAITGRRPGRTEE